MDGFKKLTPLFIGKAAKLRRFKVINYFHEWLVSLNADMKKTETQNSTVFFFF
jgi:hypothetical protein